MGSFLTREVAVDVAARAGGKLLNAGDGRDAADGGFDGGGFCAGRRDG